MVSPNQVLRYWRNSLVDAQKLGVNASVLGDKDRAFTVDQASLQGGQLNSTTLHRLLTLHSPAKEDGAEREWSIEGLICPIVLQAKYKHGARRRAKDLIPLWIPVLVTKEGYLKPTSAGLPWLSRETLEPIWRNTDLPTIGTMDDYDHFLNEDPPPDSFSDWASMWQWANRLLRAVTNLPSAESKLEGYGLQTASGSEEPQPYLVLAEPSDRGISGALIRAYDCFEAVQPLPRLFQRIAQPEPAPQRNLLEGTASLRLTASHLGQMSAGYSLSSSQRKALIHFWSLGEGEVLAVNGPPGTGKTTLLHSIIASLFVQSAVEGRCPPLILATSTNNQAVTNIIDSFKTVPSGGLASRWIPNLNSYGLYFPSGERQKEATERGFQFIDPTKASGFASTIESSDFLQEAKALFLKRYEEYFGACPPDLHSAVEDVHRRLRGLARRLEVLPGAWLAAHEAQMSLGELAAKISSQEGLAAKAAQAAATWRATLQDWIGYQAITPWWMVMLGFFGPVKRQLELRARGFADLHHLKYEPEDGPGELDRNIRQSYTEWARRVDDARRVVAELQLEESRLKSSIQEYRDDLEALGLPSEMNVPDQDRLDITTRCEAFNLASHYWEGRWLLEREERQSRGQRWEPTAEGRLSQLRSWAMLAPCFVATLFRVPTVMSVHGRRGGPYLGEALDLLIVDEAGQVSPEAGGVAFAFAKKAIVVGDVLQIEPIWGLPVHVDVGNLKSSGLAQDVLPISHWASKGNMMTVAQQASPFWAYPDVRGMLLTEHRRCFKSLIEFCNQLAYGGRLEPKRPDPQEVGITPIWGYAHIPGRAEKRNGSWGNALEAAAIAQWIKDHEQALITCDSAGQDGRGEGKDLARVVAVVTPFAFQRELIRRELSQRGIPNLTVGTVHSLQGAERTIVLFSPTYTYRERPPYFFDAGVNMLNVAVSRAKDAFLVFGDMEIFDSDRRKGGSLAPSALLGRYLFAKEDNALEGYSIPAPLTKSPFPGAQVQPISTLAGHREALLQCLNLAKKEIIVESPWITADALRADGLDGIIGETVSRGVHVVVVTDRLKNTEFGRAVDEPLRASAQVALKLLQEAGADVRWATKIHGKNVFVDRSLLILGSFNWLSACRSESGRFYSSDSSLRCEGPGVAEWIDELADLIRPHLLVSDSLTR